MFVIGGLNIISAGGLLSNDLKSVGVSIRHISLI